MRKVTSRFNRPLVGTGAFLIVLALATPAWATSAAGPTTISGWSSAVVSFFTSNVGSIALALIGLATATVILAVGRNLLSRIWNALASLGGSNPVGKGRGR